MLILTRKRGECIQIGDDISVTIVRIGPGRVRVGIDAPQSLNIARTELLPGAEQKPVEESANVPGRTITTSPTG